MDADNATTKPTIETVLERINALGESLHADITRIDTRLEKFNERFNDVDERLDQIEALANRSRLDVLNMRSDFRQWRDQLKELLPQAP